MDAETQPSELKFWRSLLNIAAGSFSLISLSQRAFDIGVTGLLATFLDYYRAIFYPFVNPLYALLSRISPFSLPESYRDLFLLAFLFSLISMRSVPDVTGKKEALGPTAQAAVDIMSAVLLAVPLLGLAAPLILAVGAIGDWRHRRFGFVDDLSRFLFSFLCMVAVAVAFFAISGT